AVRVPGGGEHGGAEDAPVEVAGGQRVLGGGAGLHVLQLHPVRGVVDRDDVPAGDGDVTASPSVDRVDVVGRGRRGQVDRAPAVRGPAVVAERALALDLRALHDAAGPGRVHRVGDRLEAVGGRDRQRGGLGVGVRREEGQGSGGGRQGQCGGESAAYE